MKSDIRVYVVFLPLFYGLVCCCFVVFLHRRALIESEVELYCATMLLRSLSLYIIETVLDVLKDDVP